MNRTANGGRPATTSTPGVKALPPDSGTYDVVVIGAGISGLACAYQLRRAGKNPLILEAAGRPGGKISSQWHDGFLLENGPASIRGTSRELEELIELLSLRDAVRTPAPEASRRFVLRGGALRALPAGPGGLIGSPLFSLRAKLRLLAEPFIRPRRSDAATAEEESVAAFVRRRLGSEFLEYAVDPFVAGIFAGDAETLSLKSAFPQLSALESAHGSVAKGVLHAGRQKRAARKRSKRAGAAAGPPRASQITFHDGLSTLTDALSRELANRLYLESRVERLSPAEGGVEIEVHRGEARTTITASRVVMAVPAQAAARLVEPVDWALAEKLSEIPYPPVRVINVAYRRKDIRRPLDGFGFLLPKSEGCSLLGAIWSSTVFPHRAPADGALFTCFVGGARQPEAAVPERVPTGDILGELARIMEIHGEPLFVKEHYWEEAIPQYAIGHAATIDAVREFEKQHPALSLIGNYRGGVALADCLREAGRVAAEITATSHET